MKSIKEYINESRGTIISEFKKRIDDLEKLAEQRADSTVSDAIEDAVDDLSSILEKMQKKAENLNVIKRVFNITSNDQQELKKYQYFMLSILKFYIGLINYYQNNLHSIDLGYEDLWTNGLSYMLYNPLDYADMEELDTLIDRAMKDKVLGDEKDEKLYKGLFMQALMNLNGLCKITTGKYWQ